MRVLPTVFLLLIAGLATKAETLDEILAKRDKIASLFQSMSANFEVRIKSTLAKDETRRLGQIKLKRTGPDRFAALISMFGVHTSWFELKGTQLTSYDAPEPPTDEDISSGYEMFFALCPGASVASLKALYTISLDKGPSTGKLPAYHLLLTPLSITHDVQLVDLFLDRKSLRPIGGAIHTSDSTYTVSLSSVSWDLPLPDAIIHGKRQHK